MRKPESAGPGEGSSNTVGIVFVGAAAAAGFGAAAAGFGAAALGLGAAAVGFGAAAVGFGAAAAAGGCAVGTTNCGRASAGRAVGGAWEPRAAWVAGLGAGLNSAMLGAAAFIGCGLVTRLLAGCRGSATRGVLATGGELAAAVGILGEAAGLGDSAVAAGDTAGAAGVNLGRPIRGARTAETFGLPAAWQRQSGLHH